MVARAVVGKTLVSSCLIDRVVSSWIKLWEVPVTSNGLHRACSTALVASAARESAGAVSAARWHGLAPTKTASFSACSQREYRTHRRIPRALPELPPSSARRITSHRRPATEQRTCSETSPEAVTATELAGNRSRRNSLELRQRAPIGGLKSSQPAAGLPHVLRAQRTFINSTPRA
jgi:hypothetical protein